MDEMRGEIDGTDQRFCATCGRPHVFCACLPEPEVMSSDAWFKPENKPIRVQSTRERIENDLPVTLDQMEEWALFYAEHCFPIRPDGCVSYDAFIHTASFLPIEQRIEALHLFNRKRYRR